MNSILAMSGPGKTNKDLNKINLLSDLIFIYH